MWLQELESDPRPYGWETTTLLLSYSRVNLNIATYFSIFFNKYSCNMQVILFFKCVLEAFMRPNWTTHHHHQVSCSVAGTSPCIEPISFTNLLHWGRSNARASASESDKPIRCRFLVMTFPADNGLKWTGYVGCSVESLLTWTYQRIPHCAARWDWQHSAVVQNKWTTAVDQLFPKWGPGPPMEFMTHW